jgi:hypothetical protein
MKFMSEQAIDSFVELWTLLYKLNVVESQYFEPTPVILGLTRLENGMKK